MELKEYIKYVLEAMKGGFEEVEFEINVFSGNFSSKVFVTNEETGNKIKFKVNKKKK